MIRLLYVGTLTPGTTSMQRLNAFHDMGCAVAAIDTAPREGLTPARLAWERVRRRVAGPRDWADANREIVARVQRDTYDVLWIDKGLTIAAPTLRAVRAIQPGCRVLGFSPDDMYARHNQSPQFRAHLPLYNVFFTTKSFGVRELEALGCPRVVFQHNSYDPRTHRPMTTGVVERLRYGGEVGFVGTFEAARAASIEALARAGIAIRVYGDGWSHLAGRWPALRIEGRALYGDEYATAINAFDVNLCFLRKLNRDRQTTRSVEIPACGAFMLAERTDEHAALFREGAEAELFGSDAELLEKVRYYLAHPDERRRIAAAGRARCLAGRYSYRERLADMLCIAGVGGSAAVSSNVGSPILPSGHRVIEPLTPEPMTQ